MSIWQLAASEVYRSPTVVCVAVAESQVSAVRLDSGFSVWATRRPRAIVLRERDKVTVTALGDTADSLQSLCDAVPELAEMLELR